MYLRLSINLHEKQMFPLCKEKHLFKGHRWERRTSTINKRQWQLPLSLLLLRSFSHGFNSNNSFKVVSSHYLVKDIFHTSTALRFIHWAIPKTAMTILLNKSNPCVHS